MKQIKKSLLSSKIRVTYHAKERMEKRGYTSSDIMNCIWTGNITKLQVMKGKICAVVEGNDLDNFPMVLIVGKDDVNQKRLAIISVFPPIKPTFSRVI